MSRLRLWLARLVCPGTHFVGRVQKIPLDRPIGEVVTLPEGAIDSLLSSDLHSWRLATPQEPEDA